MIAEKEIIPLIIDNIKKNKNNILKQFVLTPDTKESRKEFMVEATEPENWKNISDEDETSEYVFDCEPFDDQLRAYVFVENNNISRVEIIGE